MSMLVDVLLSTAIYAATLRVLTPLLFAAIGGMLSEVAGVPNIVLEGAMLAGACAGGLVAGHSGNTALGLGAAILAGAFVGLVLGVMHLELGADPIISGIGINLLVAGTTVFVVYSTLGDKSGSSSLGSHTLPKVNIPGLDSVPIVGDILNGQSILTWAALVVWAVVAFVLARTPFGMRLRACGEAPDAARSVGIDVRRMRYVAVVLSGALCGVGGGFMSMAYVSYFVRDMTAGRGYIALAAVFLGRKRPVGVLAACLLFAFADALAVRLGNFNVPSQLVTAIPYAAAFVAVGYFAWRSSRSRTAVNRDLAAWPGES